MRGVFWEGEDLYENAGFKEKNHIQICVRNSNCIKGFFIPREADDGLESGYSRPCAFQATIDIKMTANSSLLRPSTGYHVGRLLFQSRVN